MLCMRVKYVYNVTIKNLRLRYIITFPIAFSTNNLIYLQFIARGPVEMRARFVKRMDGLVQVPAQQHPGGAQGDCGQHIPKQEKTHMR